MRALPKDVNHWILPHDIREASREEPKNTIYRRNIGDDIALKPLVIECVVWVFAVSDVNRPAVTNKGKGHLVK